MAFSGLFISTVGLVLDGHATLCLFMVALVCTSNWGIDTSDSKARCRMHVCGLIYSFPCCLLYIRYIMCGHGIHTPHNIRSDKMQWVDPTLRTSSRTVILRSGPPDPRNWLYISLVHMHFNFLSVLLLNTFSILWVFTLWCLSGSFLCFAKWW